MHTGFLSVTSRNMLGNVAVGSMFMLSGAMRLAGVDGPLVVTCLSALLALTVTSLLANSSGGREREDEMALLHSGRAANLALWVTLTAVAIVSAVGLIIGTNIDLAGVGFLVIGLSLTIYGTSFAVLEGGILPC